jgi:hypothetical protein
MLSNGTTVSTAPACTISSTRASAHMKQHIIQQ